MQPRPCLNQRYFEFAYHGIEGEARRLLDRYLTESWPCARESDWVFDPVSLPSGQRILERDRHLQAEVLLAALVLLVVRCRSSGADRAANAALVGKLVSRLARRRLPLREQQPGRIVGLLADHAVLFTETIPVLGVLRLVRRYVDACGLDGSLRTGLRRLQADWSCDWYVNPLDIIQRRIAEMVGEAPGRKAAAEATANWQAEQASAVVSGSGLE